LSKTQSILASLVAENRTVRDRIPEGGPIMAEDHLNTETSVSAEITETGVKAAAKSRTVAAIDRLVGNVADWGNVLLEGGLSRRRAHIEGERALIEAAAKYGVERMGLDDEFAKRAFENHFKKIAQAQINKDAVVGAAVEDLRQNVPSDEQAASGPELVSEEFMGRFEGYAETATTEQLRERWGRILAGEIRKPGTFSSKVLRTTDELDGETARIFETLMRYQVGDVLIKPLMNPDLDFNTTLKLVGAGLLVDPGFGGQSRLFGSAATTAGKKLWISPFGSVALAIPQDTAIDYGSNEILSNNDGTPSIPVYILTDVGTALSSILPANEPRVAAEYADKLRGILPEGALQMYASSPDGTLRLIKSA
jgi:hypothetical protein